MMVMWILCACGSAVFAGMTAILAKMGIKNVNSHLVTALRTVVVLIFAWLMAAISGSIGTIQALSNQTKLFLALSGIATGASWICYFRALALEDVNKVAPIDKCSTILTMVLAFLLFGEPIGPFKILGMIAMAIGTFLMIEKKKSDGKHSHIGLIYACLSALFASLTAILGKVGIRDVESNLGTAIRTNVVLVMAWIIVFALHKEKEIKNITKRDGCFIVLSGLATGLSWLCFYRALQLGPASVVVPIDKLSILVTVIFSFVVLKEKISIKGLIGLVILVMGTLCLLL